LIEFKEFWLAQVDDFRTFLGNFVSNVPQVVPTIGRMTFRLSGPHFALAGVFSINLFEG
jgi:hypothetical protein